MIEEKDILALEVPWLRDLCTCLLTQGTCPIVLQDLPENHSGPPPQAIGSLVNNSWLPRLLVLLGVWQDWDYYKAQLGGLGKESGEPSPSTQVSRG